MHLKALEMLLFGFPEDIKLLEHFFRSYQKNYTFDVVGISEVDEPSTSEYFDEPRPGAKIFGPHEQRSFKRRLEAGLAPRARVAAEQGHPPKGLKNGGRRKNGG